MTTSTVTKLLAALAAAVASCAGAADGVTLTASTGFDYSSGKYGSATATTILYVPFIAKYETGRWTAKATFPYLEINSPGSVVGGGNDVVVIGTNNNTQRTRASGMGDVVAAVSYSALEGQANGVFLDLTAKVKLPTADDQKGLGTGKTDHTFLADIYRSQGRFTLLGSVGYKNTGKPEGLGLKNVWFAGIGGAWRFDGSTSAGLLWDARQPTRDSVDGARDLTLYVTHKWSSSLKMQLYTYRGFSDASADLGGGALLTLGF